VDELRPLVLSHTTTRLKFLASHSVARGGESIRKERNIEVYTVNIIQQVSII